MGRLFALRIVLLVSLLLIPDLAHGDDQPAANSQPLIYEVVPVDDRIALGGGLWVEARLTNAGTRPVEVYWGDYAFVDVYQFTITGPNGRRVPSRGLEAEGRAAPPAGSLRHFRRLAPRKSLSYRMLLGNTVGGNTQRVLFSRPGRYSIDCRFSCHVAQAIDKTGQLMDRPQAWTGQLEGPSFLAEVDDAGAGMPPGLTLTGAVRAQGRPLAGALVRAEVERPSANGVYTQLVAQELTDSKGNYQMVRLPRDAAAFHLKVSKSGHLPASRRAANAGDGKLAEQSFQLDPCQQIEGRVVGKDNEGVAAATVRSALSTAYTNDAGGFVIDAPSGDRVRLQVVRRGYRYAEAEVDPSQQTIVRLTPDSLLAVRGVAVLLSGSPLAKHHLEFRFHPIDEQGRDLPPAEHPVRGDRATTDAAGRFRIMLPETRAYRVEVDAWDQGAETHLPHDVWSSQWRRVTPGLDERELAFDDRGSLRVTVRESTPLPQEVQLRVLVRRQTPTSGRRPIRQRDTAANGLDWRIGPVAPGVYQAVVTVLGAEHWQWTQSVEAAPQSDAPGRLEFVLPELHFGSVTGQVLLPNGLPGCRVAAVVRRLGGLGRRVDRRPWAV